MKRLIITEEEKKSILLKHGSKSFINEADADVQAIQTAVGVKADGVAGSQTIKAILSKLGGKPSPEPAAPAKPATPVPTQELPQQITPAAAPAAAPAASPTTTTFSATPVAGATTLETACGERKTNKDFRQCKKAFRKASGL